MKTSAQPKNQTRLYRPKSHKGKENLFGTDGVRGLANTYPMIPEVAIRLAMAASVRFRSDKRRPQVVIGKDTRLSGYMLENALTSGFVSMGMDVVLVGPLPTPAIAMLTRSMRADLGVMISASHNPFPDNGIKIFGPDGYKLSDAIEAEIENLMTEDLSQHAADAEKIGRAWRMDDAPGRYIEYVKQSFPKGARLDGLKIVIDCANGAAYRVAPQILRELGAEVIPLAVTPDGKNINRNCGATAPQSLCEQVVIHQADIGLALDGDADRLIVSDEFGQVVDGDQILAVIATQLHKTGQLHKNQIVVTHMSNLGLERHCEEQGIALLRTDIGDRYVVEAMRAEKLSLGGEQSGHIVFGGLGTTGDGLVAALQLLSILSQRKVTASKLCRAFSPFPQILYNLPYDRKTLHDPLSHPDIAQLVEEAESALKGKGRLLVRLSGTEPLIRLMAEGENQQDITAFVTVLAEKIQNILSPGVEPISQTK